MTSTVKVNNVQASDGGNIINQCGTNITIGASGDTIALASGATQTGFGRTGTVDWDTSSIKTSTFTAANGSGYFANTSGGGFTMNLPAGAAGSIVSVVDYTNTFDTHNLTVAPNGSEKIGGVAASFIASTQGQSLTFVYVDGVEGWKNIQDSTSNATGNPNLAATGGTVTTSGDYKIHTFTGPGTFTVSSTSQTAAENTVSYAVIAGGGGAGGSSYVGGAGAGGFREFRGPISGCYAVSPLNGSTPITVTNTAYPITVGAGGAGSAAGVNGVVGNASVFSSVSSAGGAYADKYAGGDPAPAGGSGAGASSNCNTGGAGNTPPVSPPQGQNGGNSTGSGGGGGGGAGGAGPTRSVPCHNVVPGGSGVSTSIGGSPTTYSVGGTGVGNTPVSGGRSPSPSSGAANTGKGGNGTCSAGGTGGTGGSGIVVIRYKYQ